MSFLRWIGQSLGIRGDLYASNLLTRLGPTGGGNVETRHVKLATAGFLYALDINGDPVAFIGGDGSPATYLALGGGSGPGSGPTANDAIHIELATNFVAIEDLFTVTQAPGNNSLRVATTAYADAALAAAIAADITYTDTGIFAFGGSKGGSAISTALPSSQCSGIATAHYAYPAGGTSYQLWVYPTPASGTFTLDVQKRGFGNTAPGSSDSICASAKPTLAGNGTDFTATGSISTWTGSPINRGDMLTIVPSLNTAAVQWWALYIPLRKSL
jgi:hypothetical protein